jgi:hypothetical protein
MDLHARVVLLFAGAGGVAGAISAPLKNAWAALFLAFIFFYLVYKRASRILKFSPAEYPPVRVAKTGFFPLFIVWLIVWVMVYTLFVVG